MMGKIGKGPEPQGYGKPRFSVGIGSGSTADVCHCPASTAEHIHHKGAVMCLHRLDECAGHQVPCLYCQHTKLDHDQYGCRYSECRYKACNPNVSA